MINLAAFDVVNLAAPFSLHPVKGAALLLAAPAARSQYAYCLPRSPSCPDVWSVNAFTALLPKAGPCCYQSGNRNCLDVSGNSRSSRSRNTLDVFSRAWRRTHPILGARNQFKEVSQVGRFARGRQGGRPAPRTILRAR